MSPRDLFQQFGFFGKLALHLVPKKSGAVAVTFHNIEPQDKPWFENVIDFIDRKYGFIAPADIMSAVADKRSSNRVLLTFDDGFFSNRVIAQEVLAPRRIKALFFITEGFVGLRGEEARAFAQKNFYPARMVTADYDKQFDAMGWQDLTWLMQQGHEIGAHTHSHGVMSTLTEKDKRNEITDSADRLEERIGAPVRYFAYPFGSLKAVDVDSVILARQRFDLAFSNLRGGLVESPDRYFLLRQNLAPRMPLWIVEAIIEGRLNWRYSRDRNEAKRLFKTGIFAN